MNHEDPRTATARREVHRLRALYHHLAIYLMVVGVLAVFNLTVTPGRLWVLAVALGWGLGLAVHAARTFFLGPLLGADWEERQIRRRLDAGR